MNSNKNRILDELQWVSEEEGIEKRQRENV